MDHSKFLENLTSTKEVEITVVGRRSGRNICLPIWFILKRRTLYLVPVTGSDSNWYRNILAKPPVQISAGGEKVTVNAMPVKDPSTVSQIVQKLRSKYGTDEVAKYISKPDAALEVTI